MLALGESFVVIISNSLSSSSCYSIM